MLKKAAMEESKGWDKLIPYLLLAYKEVPRRVLGCSNSNFCTGEMSKDHLTFYERLWRWKKKTATLYYHVTHEREFDKMLDLVLRNCDNTTEKQKVWYNLNVYERPFQHREQVLIYLKVDSIVARLL